MKFSRNEIRERMSSISPMRRTAVALAATQRLSQMHSQWSTSEPSSAQRLCECFWDCLIQGTSPTDALNMEDVEALFPDEGCEGDILALAAEDFAAALLYTLRSYGCDDVDNASFALERASEYPYQVALNLFGGRVAEASEAAGDEAVAYYPMLVRELDAQNSDFNIAKKSRDDMATFINLRDNSRVAVYFTIEELQQMRGLSSQ